MGEGGIEMNFGENEPQSLSAGGNMRCCKNIYDVKGATLLRSGRLAYGLLSSERGMCQCSMCSNRTCGSDQSSWPTLTFCLK